MSLVVSDRKDELSKPPPKKKWLQNYIEEDTVTCPIGSNLRNETHKFVQLLEPQSNEGLKQFKAADTPTKLTLSQDVIGGVVQGVIDQFQNFFENDLLGNNEEGSDSGATTPSDNAIEDQQPAQPPKLLQKDIQPVVQSVISQFLNGSLSDSGFRRSRKRSHKHINCRHKDKSGVASYNSGEGLQRRSSSVIQLRKQCHEFNSQSHIKVRKIETLMRANFQENEEALNLSCPKKVTFAAEDKCYSIDSIKSFQYSKSCEVPDNILKSPAKWQTEERKMQMFPANSKVKPASTPVIFYNRSREASPCIDQPLNLVSITPPLLTDKFHRQSSPVETVSESQARAAGFTSIDNHGRKVVCTPVNHYPVIKPKPLNLTSTTSARKVFSNLFSSKPGLGLSAGGQAETREEIKRTSSNTREEIKRTSSNTREVHNRLEKNRRAHLKACFDELASCCDLDPRKASNLMVIRSAYKCIMALRRQEREQERNLAALVQEKIKRQSQLNELKREFPGFGQDSDSD